MIGSVATSRRAAAFAHALDERDIGEATAADQAAGENAGPAAPIALDQDGGCGGGGGAGAEDAGTGAEGAWADHGAERALLLAVVDGLAELPEPALSTDTKTVQRARLVAAMESAFAGGEAAAGMLPEPAAEAAGRHSGAAFPRQRSAEGGRGTHRATGLGPLGKLRPRRRLTKGLAAGGLSVGVAASALGGVATASTHALPGDSLYGLKRDMEHLQVDLAGDDTHRGEVHLDHASTRLQEARRLMERHRSGGAALDHESLAEVRRTLAGMQADAEQGHRLLNSAYRRDGSIAPMRSLSSFTEHHRAAWSRLRDRLPPQLSDAGDGVSSVFDAMDSDVRPLRKLIGGPEHEGPPRGAARHDSPHPGETPSSRPSPSDSADPDGGGDTHSDKPQSSPSDTDPEQEGLLGGGGLLGPSSDSGSGRSATPDPGRKDPRLPAPDVTLPPIVPDVLPGLRGLSQDEK